MKIGHPGEPGCQVPKVALMDDIGLTVSGTSRYGKVRKPVPRDVPQQGMDSLEILPARVFPRPLPQAEWPGGGMDPPNLGPAEAARRP